MDQKPREIPVNFVGCDFLDIYYGAEVHPNGHDVTLWQRESFEKLMPLKMRDKIMNSHGQITIQYVNSSIDGSVIAVNLH